MDWGGNMLNVPEGPSTYTTTYAGLKGVDYSAPKSEIPRNRATEIINMLPDDGEHVPIKRKGWRVDKELDSEPVCAFHDAYRNIDYISTENKTYKYQNYTYSEISSIGFKHIIPFNGNLYFINSDGIYMLSNNTITKQDPTVPYTVYGLNPDGTGGTAYYGVNAFTTRRKITFVGTETDRTFYPHATTGFATVIESVEVLAEETGEWLPVPFAASEPTTYSALDENGEVTQVTCHRKVDLVQPHPSLRQIDNIRMTIRELDTTIYEGTTIYGDYCKLGKEIYASDIMTQYGAVNMDRLFAVVENNKVYYSETSDIMYFPDDNYLVAGNASPIIGLSRLNNYLVAVTGDSSNHAVFMIKSATAVITESVTTESGDVTSVTKEQQYFSVRPATSGRGAIAGKTFATLIDEPLFLGSTGVYAITTNSLTTETVIANRSSFINPRLMKEQNLKNAIACVWKEFYIVCVNGHCYLLDSKTVSRDNAGNRCYEGYYWDNVPATTFLAYGEHLWFGTSDGNWCRFNTDIDEDCAYCDNGEFTDHGETIEYTEGTGTPVTARFTTILDDDGRPQYFKTMNKKGAVCTLLQQTASSVDIYYSKDGEDNVLFTKVVPQTTDETEIDVYPLKKVKKYRRLALTFENNKMQPFGLIKFVKSWQLGNYAKR